MDITIEAQERDFKVIFVSDLTVTFEKQATEGTLVPVEQIQRVTCAILSVIGVQIMEANELIETIGGKNEGV